MGMAGPNPGLTDKAETFLRMRARERVIHLLKKRARSLLWSRDLGERRASQRLAKQDFRKSGPLSRDERYLALRGTVIHVLPKLRALKAIHCGRRAAPIIRGGEMGTCNWCLKECQWPNRWHRGCRVWYWLLGDGPEGLRPDQNMRKMLRWNQIVAPTPCTGCGAAHHRGQMTLDHRVSVRAAARAGERKFIRAFFPENLQWLCRACHQEKTYQESRFQN